MHHFGVHQLVLKLILTYKVRTKLCHTNQCFDSPVVLNRDEDNLNIATFLKASGCDRQKHNPRTRYG